MATSDPKIISELLLAAARHKSGADWFDQHKPAEVDWSIAIDRARDHGVMPLLNHMLAPQSQVVGDRLQPLMQSVRLNHMRNMQLLAELRKLNGLLRAAGVRMLPYKGPTLALIAYGDLSLRMAGDLDLLVAPADIPAAEQVLTANGYVRDAGQADADHASAHDHHLSFTHPERRIMIELHWRVVGELFSFEPEFDALWERGSYLTVADDQLRIMSPEDTLVVLAAHGMKHFWSRLGWICDIAELVRRFTPEQWDSALARAKELGGQRIVALAVQLANDVCQANGPKMSRSICKRSAQLQRHLFRHRDDESVVSRGMRMELAGGGRLSSLLFHLRMRERGRDGWKYVFHRVFTPTAIEREWINLPWFLKPLYFTVRPIRLVAQKFA
ncbi:MAG: nucleotidyltransferase family protein [Phycisphaerae bacterium]|nr:nucleotidyltransferase family protein [Phycisphaerae bacterium]